jgi:hypothetical protein
MKANASDAMTRPLLLAGGRGGVAVLLLFLAHLPVAFAAIVFLHAPQDGGLTEAHVLTAVLLVLSLQRWRRFVFGLLSEDFYEWVFGAGGEGR